MKTGTNNSTISPVMWTERGYAFRISTIFKTFFLLSIWSFAAFCPIPVQGQSDNLTEQKIRIMADALRARSQGDFELALSLFEELQQIAPNDENVQSLIDSTRAQVNQSGYAGNLSQSDPVFGEEVNTGNRQTGSPSPQNSVAQLLQAEQRRQAYASANARAALGEAKNLLDRNDLVNSLSLINTALRNLPQTPENQILLDELHSVRKSIMIQTITRSIGRQEKGLARSFLKDYINEYGKDQNVQELAAQLDSDSMGMGGIDEDFTEDSSNSYENRQRTIDLLLGKGVAQLQSGDLRGAQATFQQVEAIEPNNADAKRYLTQIAVEQSMNGDLDRFKTREQLLGEVRQAWQRPQVFDRDFTTEEETQDNRLLQRLRYITIPKVSFSGVPLGQVVETLSALSQDFDPAGEGVNIVMIDPGKMNPEVNIALRKLQLNRILDFIVESVGFEYEIQNDAVVVRQSATGGSGVRLETEFFPLSRSTIIRLTGLDKSSAGASSVAVADPFATPMASSDATSSSDEEEALKAFLQRAGVPFESIPNANLAVADGQLIVTNTVRNLEKVRNILRRYSETKQVEIEAKFLEVQEGDLDELGINWQLLNANGGDNFSSANRSLSDAYSVQQENSKLSISRGAYLAQDLEGNLYYADPDDLSFDLSPPKLSNVIDVGEDVGNMGTIKGIYNSFNIDILVRALSRKEGSDLMSAPRVTVLSGKTAEIVVAQEFRYPESYGDIESEVGSGGDTGGRGAGVTITAGTPQDFTVRNVGVEMEVTPTVEDDGSISLLLQPVVTEFEGFVEYGGPSVAVSDDTTVHVPSGFYQPIFSVRKIRTEVTIWDGATVVMGGLTRDQVISVEDKVPILGDIPVLGRLFSSKGESSQKRNLLIFVTANLVSPGGSPTRQELDEVKPGSLYQNPTVVTPGGSVKRNLKQEK